MISSGFSICGGKWYNNNNQKACAFEPQKNFLQMFVYIFSKLWNVYSFWVRIKRVYLFLFYFSYLMWKNIHIWEYTQIFEYMQQLHIVKNNNNWVIRIFSAGFSKESWKVTWSKEKNPDSGITKHVKKQILTFFTKFWQH